LLAGGALAVPASADPHLSVAVDPPSLSFPGATSLTYRVQISTGDAPERFSVELSPGRLPDGGAA
jgi:hypothetical protein